MKHFIYTSYWYAPQMRPFEGVDVTVTIELLIQGETHGSVLEQLDKAENEQVNQVEKAAEVAGF